MAETIAVGHYCEGAGHATRMLAVAEELADAGYEFEIAGGGPGELFVETNGYSEHPLPEVDFIGSYQLESSDRLVLDGVSNFLRRVRGYVSWLRDVDPVAFVTDDFSGCLAGAIARQPCVYVSHDPTAFYETVLEQLSARIRNRIPRVTTDTFCFPKVWDGAPNIEGATVVPPIAPTDTSSAVTLPSVDVLVVPSAFSVDEHELSAALAAHGRETTLVGGEDWEPQSSLQPYIRAANLVVCSGYSTVMEAAVAGTPTVVMPVTSEQRGVASSLAGTNGFGVASSIEEVVELQGTLAAPEPRQNGVETIAEIVIAELEGGDGRFSMTPDDGVPQM